MTKKQRLKDEEVLAAIIAGAEGSGAIVRRGTWGVNTCVTYPAAPAPVIPTGPCCAVGCGLLYAGIPHGWCWSKECFAEAYGVSLSYAQGVNDRFEGGSYCNRSIDDYDRGMDVGAAAAEILNPRGLHWSDP